jgi:hypothetical protein
VHGSAMKRFLSRFASLFKDGSWLEAGILRLLRVLFWIAVLLPVLIVPLYYFVFSVVA